jgi:hypothetical protein
MRNATIASVKTLIKFLLWTAVAAVCTAAVDRLADVNIPVVYVPIVAAVLKSIATYAQTNSNEKK